MFFRKTELGRKGSTQQQWKNLPHLACQEKRETAVHSSKDGECLITNTDLVKLTIVFNAGFEKL